MNHQKSRLPIIYVSHDYTLTMDVILSVLLVLLMIIIIMLCYCNVLQLPCKLWPMLNIKLNWHYFVFHCYEYPGVYVIFTS